jgi:hypothetical protein
MPRLRQKPLTTIAGWIALISAFGICLAVILFSWPDLSPRQRPGAGQVAGCCETEAGKVVLISGPGR